MHLMIWKLLELFQLGFIGGFKNCHNAQFHQYVLYFDASAFQIFRDAASLYAAISANT